LPPDRAGRPKIADRCETHADHQQGQHERDQRLLDHDVQVPQAVLEDRDQVRGRDPHEDREQRRDEQDREDHVADAPLIQAEDADQREEQEDPRDPRTGHGRHGDQPAHLLTFLASGAPEPLPDGDHGREARADDHQGPDAHEGVARAPFRERVDPDRVRVQDPVFDEVVERAGRERVRGGGDTDPGEQDPNGPSPSGAGRMSVGEQ
jgi:hypothetical protein